MSSIFTKQGYLPSEETDVKIPREFFPKKQHPVYTQSPETQTPPLVDREDDAPSKEYEDYLEGESGLGDKKNKERMLITYFYKTWLPMNWEPAIKENPEVILNLLPQDLTPPSSQTEIASSIFKLYLTKLRLYPGSFTQEKLKVFSTVSENLIKRKNSTYDLIDNGGVNKEEYKKLLSAESLNQFKSYMHQIDQLTFTLLHPENYMDQEKRKSISEDIDAIKKEVLRILNAPVREIEDEKKMQRYKDFLENKKNVKDTFKDISGDSLRNFIQLENEFKLQEESEKKEKKKEKLFDEPKDLEELWEGEENIDEDAPKLPDDYMEEDEKPDRFDLLKSKDLAGVDESEDVEEDIIDFKEFNKSDISKMMNLYTYSELNSIFTKVLQEIPYSVKDLYIKYRENIESDYMNISDKVKRRRKDKAVSLKEKGDFDLTAGWSDKFREKYKDQQVTVGNDGNPILEGDTVFFFTDSPKIKSDLMDVQNKYWRDYYTDKMKELPMDQGKDFSGSNAPSPGPEWEFLSTIFDAGAPVQVLNINRSDLGSKDNFNAKVTINIQGTIFEVFNYELFKTFTEKRYSFSVEDYFYIREAFLQSMIFNYYRNKIAIGDLVSGSSETYVDPSKENKVVDVDVTSDPKDMSKILVKKNPDGTQEAFKEDSPKAKEFDTMLPVSS